MFFPHLRGLSKSPVLVGGLILLVALAVGAYVLYGTGLFQEEPIKKVGSLDYEQVLGLDMFTQAEKQFQKLRKEKEAKAKAIVGDKDLSDQEKMVKLNQLQMELEQERNKIFNPLKTRAEAAVASVARKEGMTVVLDKRIVVYGVPDITEKVKTLLRSGEEIRIPREEDTSTAPIGYFDQDVVRSLKVFQEADLEVFKLRQKLMKEYEERARDLSPSEREALQKELSIRFEARREQIMAPMYQKVNQAVKKVADSQDLSLVLDKQHVMYGGRNITDAVVETFLQNFSSSPKQQPEAGEET